jgi:hypothetical protein
LKGQISSPASNAKSAKQAIFDSSGVGTDLRSSQKTNLSGQTDSQVAGDLLRDELPSKKMPTFLKPSGVHDAGGADRNETSAMKRERSTSPGPEPKTDKPKKKKKRDNSGN